MFNELKHFILMGVMITPATVVNYGIVWYALVIQNTTSWIGVSIIIIGDVIGLLVNSIVYKRYYDKVRNWFGIN